MKDLIKRIDEIYESFQCNLTCVLCGDIIENCIMYIPCGHSFCGKCIEKFDQCPNCTLKIQDKNNIKALDEIACKFSSSNNMFNIFKDNKS